MNGKGGWLRKGLKLLMHILVFLLLTVLTQVGGVVYVLALIATKIWQPQFRFKLLLIFVVIYSLTIFVFVPILAPLGGREKVKNRFNVEPVNYIGGLMNRNYVTPELNKYLDEVSQYLAKTNPSLKLRYLDACFPFFDGFPLLPHLSHNDGNKIDVSLVYENADEMIINKSKSITGYGVFEQPSNMEINQTEQCIKKGFWQYDFPKYLTLGTKNEELVFSTDGTKDLLVSLLSSKKLQKVFIEPHLKRRLGLTDSRIRYQGCHSVRHDDHIHVQINQ